MDSRTPGQTWSHSICSHSIWPISRASFPSICKTRIMQFGPVSRFLIVIRPNLSFFPGGISCVSDNLSWRKAYMLCKRRWRMTLLSVIAPLLRLLAYLTQTCRGMQINSWWWLSTFQRMASRGQRFNSLRWNQSRTLTLRINNLSSRSKTTRSLIWCPISLKTMTRWTSDSCRRGRNCTIRERWRQTCSSICSSQMCCWWHHAQSGSCRQWSWKTGCCHNIDTTTRVDLSRVLHTSMNCAGNSSRSLRASIMRLGVFNDRAKTWMWALLKLH